MSPTLNTHGEMTLIDKLCWNCEQSMHGKSHGFGTMDFVCLTRDIGSVSDMLASWSWCHGLVYSHLSTWHRRREE
jgi:hypothetical protein